MGSGSAIDPRDLVREVRIWASGLADDEKRRGFLPAMATDSTQEMLHQLAVGLAHVLVRQTSVADEVTVDHPIVRGLVRLYGHPQFPRARLRADDLRLDCDGEFQLVPAIDSIHRGTPLPFGPGPLLGDLAGWIAIAADGYPWDASRSFDQQHFGDGTAAQRLMLEIAAAEILGLFP